MFEEFKMNTITKNDFVAGLGDKADKEEIANIVSYKILDLIFRKYCSNIDFRSNEKNMIVVSVVLITV